MSPCSLRPDGCRAMPILSTDRPRPGYRSRPRSCNHLTALQGQPRGLHAAPAGLHAPGRQASVAPGPGQRRTGGRRWRPPVPFWSGRGRRLGRRLGWRRSRRRRGRFRRQRLDRWCRGGRRIAGDRGRCDGDDQDDPLHGCPLVRMQRPTVADCGNAMLAGSALPTGHPTVDSAHSGVATILWERGHDCGQALRYRCNERRCRASPAVSLYRSRSRGRTCAVVPFQRRGTAFLGRMTT